MMNTVLNRTSQQYVGNPKISTISGGPCFSHIRTFVHSHIRTFAHSHIRTFAQQSIFSKHLWIPLLLSILDKKYCHDTYCTVGVQTYMDSENIILMRRPILNVSYRHRGCASWSTILPFRYQASLFSA
jgi:hypothetical protein